MNQKIKRIKEKPIIFFDLETTGVNVSKDRIVEIACTKYNVDGTTEKKYSLINPEMDIPFEASEVHGITNDKVKDAPTFKRLGSSMREWFKDCDLAGYNSDNFDVPLLSAEFERVGLEGINWNPNLLDILKLYRHLYPNTLSAVYERLTGKVLEDAHSADADISATKEISDILIQKLSEVEEKSVKNIDNFLQGDKKRFDLAGKLYIDVDGVVRYNFGKDVDKSVKDFPGFAEWMLKQDFPNETKKKIRELLAQ